MSGVTAAVILTPAAVVLLGIIASTLAGIGASAFRPQARGVHKADARRPADRGREFPHLWLGS